MACFPDASQGQCRGSVLPPKSLILLVGAPRFELGTPSPPDWCANRAALRSARAGTSTLAPQPAQGRAGRPRNGGFPCGKSARRLGFISGAASATRRQAATSSEPAASPAAPSRARRPRNRSPRSTPFALITGDCASAIASSAQATTRAMSTIAPMNLRRRMGMASLVCEGSCTTIWSAPSRKRRMHDQTRSVFRDPPAAPSGCGCWRSRR